MSVSERLDTPPLDWAAEWLNSEPLGPAELRGHAVLVNFWTLTCINWLRQEPYVRAWSQSYRDDGLIVVGVHTPEFSFEHETDHVRQATKERGIDYPVAVDNDYAIWGAFDNQYWPALYFVDTKGVIRDEHFGEGRYEQSERMIQELLGVERELLSIEGLGVEAAADWNHSRRPQTYLGYGAASASRRRTTQPSTNATSMCSPTACHSTPGVWPASGRSAARASRSARPAEASTSASTRAMRISSCLREHESRSRSASFSTARFRATRTGSTSTRTARCAPRRPPVPARA